MSNNFSQLLDLAIKQGFSRSSLMAEIKQAIIAQFREQNPKAAIGIAVLIDEETGLIKIFAGDKEIGSEKFSQEAIQLAQKILIDKVAQGSSSPQVSEQTTNTVNKIKKAGSGILGKIFFWAYNIYFIFFNLTMALSLVFGRNFKTIINNFDWAQALISLAIFFLPIITVIYVWRKGLQRQSSSLMKLFFLLELPLAVLLLLSSSLIGHTTVFTALSLVALLAIPLIIYIHFSKVELSTLAKQIFAFFSQFSTLMLGYYVLLFAFFLPLIVIGIPKMYLIDTGLFDRGYGSLINYPGLFIRLSFALIFFLLILALTTLPFIILRSLWKITEKNRLALMEILGEKRAEKQIAITWAIVLVLFLVSLFKWPDHRLLSQLNEFDQEADYSTQETSAIPLVKEEEKLQKLVERKVEARSYYLFDKDDDLIEMVYEEVFENDTFAKLVQDAFTNLAYPLVYWEKWEEQRALTENFQYLFGYPYYQSQSDEEDEMDLRLKTPEEDEEQNVLLTYREITVNTEADGLLANITIEEEYQNQTNQEQEIIYEFNLPDEVAFYDLKLGPNLEYSGVIAPKGAAQKVYERELQARRDPALLEQTGPNQYRLRIFPVPGRNDFSTLQGQRQKVAFSYSVAQSDGSYALPYYTKESNVLIDGSSSMTLSYDGQISYLKEEKNQLAATDGDLWDLCQNQEQVFSLVEAGKTAKLIVHANDAELQKMACAEIKEILPLLKDYRLAIVYDTSFNNQEDKTLEKFANLLSETDANWLNETQVDLYKFNQVISQGEKLSSENFKDLLKPVHFSKVSDFSKLGEIKAQYDLVILVTSQDIDFSQLTNFPFSKPNITYWVSEDKLPALNMEMTSGLWQTGGGTSTTIETALRNFLIKKTVADKYASNATVLNQKLSLEYTGLSDNLTANLFTGASAFVQISNKALLAKFVNQQDKEVVGDINLLDQLDAAARQANLVSPYSSSIALVNQQQIENLKRLMAQYNRFQDTQVVENVPATPWPWMPQPMPIDGFMTRDLMMMEQAMPGTAAPGFSSNMIFDSRMATTDLASVGVKNIGYAGELSTGLGVGLMSLAGGSSFMIGTAVIGAIAFVIYLIQQLKKKKEK